VSYHVVTTRNDEDLNIWEKSGPNKLAFGEHQVRVSRTQCRVSS
jgi:hypothetical protein